MATNPNDVWTAMFLTVPPFLGLLVGAVTGLLWRVPHQRVAATMSVGAGMLLAGASLRVAADVLRLAGPVATTLALLLGAAVFSTTNAGLARLGAAHRKRCGECIAQPSEADRPGSGAAIALGHALDVVPEAIVLGIALRTPGVPFALLLAFTLGNLPAALASTNGMRTAGRSRAYIAGVWSGVVVAGVLTVGGGYAAFGALNAAWPLRLQAFGAGALLAMAAETMIPEATHDSPHFSGLLAALGFGLLLLVGAPAR